jgi:hypothetical protein
MNEEILAGLKNAKNHNFTLEQASQSFINAGYNPVEVKEAADFVLRGISPLPTMIKEETPSAGALPVKKEVPKKVIWIILALVGVILVGLILAILLFKDKFLGIIDSIFP